RTVGSPDGLFLADHVPPTERAARLLVDLMSQIHEALLAEAIENESLIEDAAFVGKLDNLLGAITSVRVAGEVEVAREGERKDAEKGGGGASVSLAPRPAAEVHRAREVAKESRELIRETRRGTERLTLNFGDVARALRELAE